MKWAWLVSLKLIHIVFLFDVDLAIQKISPIIHKVTATQKYFFCRITNISTKLFCCATYIRKPPGLGLFRF